MPWSAASPCGAPRGSGPPARRRSSRARDYPRPSKRRQAASVQSAIRAICWMYDWWDAGLLPPRIARRRDKQGPDEAILRAIAEHWGELQPLLDEPRIAARGWVDAATFRRALQEARFGKPGDFLPALLPSLALEVWMRAAEHLTSPPARSLPA